MSSVFTVGDADFEVCVVSSEKEFLEYVKANKFKVDYKWMLENSIGVTTDLGVYKGVRRVVISLNLGKLDSVESIASTAAHEATHVLGLMRSRMDCYSDIEEWDCYFVDKIVFKTMQYAIKKLRGKR